MAVRPVSPDPDHVDADEPRAPPTEVWRQLGPQERAAWIARLGPIPQELMPPISDPHIDAERAVEDAVGGWFKRRRTRAYIGRGLTVYYPNEPRFAPDIFIVFDVDDGQRTTWIVDHEGRGLDFVLEIHFAGDLKKDMLRNTAWFARLGIPEYFVYEVRRERLHGWRLNADLGVYTPIVPQAGQWESKVLGAHLTMTEGQLRLYVDGALLPLAIEVQAALSSALDAAIRRAEAEAQRAEAEAQRAEALAAEVALLRAELDRLRREPSSEG